MISIFILLHSIMKKEVLHSNVPRLVFFNGCQIFANMLVTLLACNLFLENTLPFSYKMDQEW